jgi:hypothetical protein
VTKRKENFDDRAVMELYLEVRREVTEGSKLVDWAEDEIDQAMKRHPTEADRIFHAFPLLVPTLSSQAWAVEFVVRGHCRELLDASGPGATPSAARPPSAASPCLRYPGRCRARCGKRLLLAHVGAGISGPQGVEPRVGAS